MAHSMSEFLKKEALQDVSREKEIYKDHIEGLQKKANDQKISLRNIQKTAQKIQKGGVSGWVGALVVSAVAGPSVGLALGLTTATVLSLNVIVKQVAKAAEKKNKLKRMQLEKIKDAALKTGSIRFAVDFACDPKMQEKPLMSKKETVELLNPNQLKRKLHRLREGQQKNHAMVIRTRPRLK